MMIKDAMEKNEKATPNGADLEVLKKYFGMCFNSDGSLDLEKLKARLGGSGGDFERGLRIEVSRQELCAAFDFAGDDDGRGADHCDVARRPRFHGTTNEVRT